MISQSSAIFLDNPIAITATGDTRMGKKWELNISKGLIC